ncbi:hypothetical protein AJ80_05423 [Polytolypa hystricis UAMH7299]|uniref:Mid2 domain-containing protein n=1 Tax=Polytolypa hystricis (strain UAMH7299) TaxID=1447883 RepID=A0A2B7Y3D5_POLH7|nr:hypothetical protein AJ80_05423 [Polytolypa hystricis UAMH7299]
MVQPYMSLFVAALLSIQGAEAGSRGLLPRETPIGLMANIGMSPRPTDVPGAPPGLPRELVKRQSRTELPYPPPRYYCGLVNGDINNLLTCANARANCIYSSTIVDCCISEEISQCTNRPTTCLNWEDECDEACQSDPLTIRCSLSTKPFCGTYYFGGGTMLLGCRSINSVTKQVVPLTEYYASALGPDYTTIAITSVEDNNKLPLSPGTATTSSSSSSSLTSTQGTETETETRPTGSSTSTADAAASEDADDDDDDDDDDDRQKQGSGALSGGAIAGIVIGSVAVVAGFAAFLLWFFLVKKRRENAVQQASAVPMMQDTDHSAGGGHAAAGYFAPDKKGETPPTYSAVGGPIAQRNFNRGPTEMEASQPNTSPVEMPGSPSTASAVSPLPPSVADMYATNSGPVPEQIYEMPSERDQR